MPEVVWTVGWLISALKQNMCLAKQQPLRSAQRSSQGCLETPHLYLCVHIQLQLPDNIKKRGWEILLQNCWRKKCLGPTDITAAAISLLSTSGKGKAAVAWSPHMGSGGSHGCPVGCSVFTSTFIFSSGGFIIGGEFAGVFFFFFPFVLPRWHFFISHIPNFYGTTLPFSRIFHLREYLNVLQASQMTHWALRQAYITSH